MITSRRWTRAVSRSRSGHTQVGGGAGAMMVRVVGGHRGVGGARAITGGGRGGAIVGRGAGWPVVRGGGSWPVIRGNC